MNNGRYAIGYIFIGFLAYSEFGIISHVILPLILAMFAFRFKSSTWLVIAALSITDIGIGDSYTPDLLRKTIITALLVILISKAKYRTHRLLIYLLGSVFITTLYNSLFGIIDSNTLVRDLFILFLLFLPGLNLDIRPIIHFGVGAAFGVIFLHFVHGMAFTEYHSFTSTKSIIALPLFYFMSRKKISLKTVILILSSLSAIFLLQTRMILVTISLVLLLRFVFTITLRKTLITGIIIYLLPIVMVSLPGAKSVQVFIDLFSFSRSLDMDYLKLLDPVRWGEH